MKYLFSCWKKVEKALARGALLIFDYDGTLTPIVEKPESALLSEGMRNLLARASQYYALGIMSGRPLREVKKLVKLRGIYFSGNHGFEVEGPGIKFVKQEAEQARPILKKICDGLKGKLSRVEGVIVEDKGLTASIHYRLVAPKDFKRLEATFEREVKPYVDSGKIMVTRGKKVLEIRPKIEWDKGKAVLWVIDVVDPKGKLTPVYIGDDQTDEDAFLALKNKGVTVLVAERRRRSHAMFFLKNVAEVKIFLKELAKA
jgi:trehalose-phosphatase